jgi:hypothetical protein
MLAYLLWNGGGPVSKGRLIMKGSKVDEAASGQYPSPVVMIFVG